VPGRAAGADILATMTTGGRELRATTEYGLVRLLAEAGALDDATQRLFELIGGAFGWSAGGLLLADSEAGLLRWADDWSTGEPELVTFLRLSRRLTWAPGVGLPGRVWESGEPAWIPDVTADPNFPRVQAAIAAGLKAAVAFPTPGPTARSASWSSSGPGPASPRPSTSS
jgi:hypothetical protein